ncbi:MAG: FAD-dependent oxidoreductase [Clostridiales bacterium]|nr:FAD-dependent oxidoreductase [Clostridiales bacterium]
MKTEKSAVSYPCGTFAGEYDVVVVGGGTAGAFAAIAAADSGKKVLLLERAYSLGGSATLAQVTPLMANVLPKYTDNSYLTLRLKERMMAVGAENHPNWSVGGGSFNPVRLAYELEQMAQESGVEILYGADFVGVNREGDRIESVCINTINGLQLVRGKTFVDATGDALVAWRAGCPCVTGDEKTGKNQPASLRFSVAGVHMPGFRAFLNSIGIPIEDDDEYAELGCIWSNGCKPSVQMLPLFSKGIEDGELEQGDVEYFQCFCAPCLNGMVYFNCPEAVDLRNTVDAASVTKIVLTCRAAAVRLHTFFKKHVGGFENSTIAAFAEIPGIREGRRIEGEYVLTTEDYCQCRKAEDAVTQNAYPVDVHGDTENNGSVFPAGEYMEIPYRCLIPKGVDNLLVAGRCISSSFIAQSAIRIQLVCRSLGEAAGIACSMACDREVKLSDIRGEEVRGEMIARGAVFLNR